MEQDEQHEVLAVASEVVGTEAVEIADVAGGLVEAFVAEAWVEASEVVGTEVVGTEVVGLAFVGCQAFVAAHGCVARECPH